MAHELGGDRARLITSDAQEVHHAHVVRGYQVTVGSCLLEQVIGFGQRKELWVSIIQVHRAQVELSV